MLDILDTKYLLRCSIVDENRYLLLRVHCLFFYLLARELHMLDIYSLARFDCGSSLVGLLLPLLSGLFLLPPLLLSLLLLLYPVVMVGDIMPANCATN